MHVWALKIKTDPITHNVNSHDKNESSLCMCEIWRSSKLQGHNKCSLWTPQDQNRPRLYIVSSQDQNKSMLCMCELPKSKPILIKHIVNS
jgi:hypothetical protein